MVAASDRVSADGGRLGAEERQSEGDCEQVKTTDVVCLKRLLRKELLEA